MKYIRDRADLEAVEDRALTTWAVRSRGAKRVHQEEPPAYRTHFQRDWNRVLHSRAFRKLEYKTQVLPFGVGSDFVRNRLTHTLEAAQIGVGIARALGQNEDLVQAIVLAHDLGHPPFGHKGEDELHACCGHFNHNEHSLRIVTEVEVRYPDFPGLNLTLDVLEGIEKHETDYDRIGKYRFSPSVGPGLEAQIGNTADTIAYRAHDIEDGLGSGLLKETDFAGIRFWKRLSGELKAGMRPSMRQARVTRKAINVMVEDVVGETARRLTGARVESLDDVRRSGKPLAGFSVEMAAEQRELGAFLMQHFYLSPRVKDTCAAGSRVIRRLFEKYLAEPGLLPEVEKRQIDRAAGNDRELLVAHWIAGMTDRYALLEYERVFGERVAL